MELFFVTINVTDKCHRLQTLTSQQKKVAIDKQGELAVLFSRIENKIKHIICNENSYERADWILNDDGIVRYRLKDIEWEGYV